MPQKLLDQANVGRLLESFNRISFHTLQFADHVRSQQPGRYKEIEAEYGPGGRGSGRSYSSLTFVAKSLAMYVRNWSRKSAFPELRFTGYVLAPTGYGSPKIASWSCPSGSSTNDQLSKDVLTIVGDVRLRAAAKKRLVDARLGQGKYRDELIALWKGCPLTKCSDVRVLVASHIKPWSESTRPEQLDRFNGILLTPNADRLFDRGLISFSDDGTLLRSDLVRSKVLKQLEVPLDVRIDFEPRHLPYLAIHRHKWFNK